MKNKIRISNICLAIVFLIAFTFFVIQANKEEELIQTSAEIALSNQRIGWGVKRASNHNQPDLGSKNKELIDKYKGIAMGNKDKKYVYLTFDEGYEAGYTPQILQVLKNNNVKACFFLTAHFINSQEQLVKDMISGGHIVGNHTVIHLATLQLCGA